MRHQVSTSALPGRRADRFFFTRRFRRNSLPPILPGPNFHPSTSGPKHSQELLRRLLPCGARSPRVPIVTNRMGHPELRFPTLATKDDHDAYQPAIRNCRHSCAWGPPPPKTRSLRPRVSSWSRGSPTSFWAFTICPSPPATPLLQESGPKRLRFHPRPRPRRRPWIAWPPTA